MTADHRLPALRAEIESLARPGLAKTQPQSLRERSENRGAEAYTAGFDASGMPEAVLARRVGVDRRVIRDWRSGARAVPLWAIVALPHDGRLAALKVLVDQTASSADDEEVDSALRSA
jgi:hypothetical protein